MRLRAKHLVLGQLQVVSAVRSASRYGAGSGNLLPGRMQTLLSLRFGLCAQVQPRQILCGMRRIRSPQAKGGQRTQAEVERGQLDPHKASVYKGFQPQI